MFNHSKLNFDLNRLESSAYISLNMDDNPNNNIHKKNSRTDFNHSKKEILKNFTDPESIRLNEDFLQKKKWKRWGPYLSERQWGTVREDYSSHGDVWGHFTHDQARSRVYRWGEDGILGITDRECRLCFALCFWNGKDSILKERLFGLTGPEGNHGEDVKEQYFYLESTPTHSYMKGLYKYPQNEYPYHQLVFHGRNRDQPELEINDTGIFNDNKYFDIFAEYAKNTPNDILIKITVFNRSNEDAILHLLPTLWFRNTWIWGRRDEGYWSEPEIFLQKDEKKSNFKRGRLEINHETLKKFYFEVETMDPFQESNLKSYLLSPPKFLFTNNETNFVKLWGTENKSKYVKDAFHDYVIHQKKESVNPNEIGTKVCAYHIIKIPAREHIELKMRLYSSQETCDEGDSENNKDKKSVFGKEFEEIFLKRIGEKDEFYKNRISPTLTEEERKISIQGFAGLLWSKQFYYYNIRDWLDGDPNMPPPPIQRRNGVNSDWGHFFTQDIISMPDKWEYPWFAVWDLAFHMVAFSLIDIEFAKSQLLLFLREWYMHANGALPAYEFNFSDVNPPVHAWAVWRVYKMTGPEGKRDTTFLARAFQKLVINFTWWVNRKDAKGNHIFSGGFLGLDNIGVFDRSRPLPTGGYLEQADGTAWMGLYCILMLKMALELAQKDKVYEDIASKFFEHFLMISDSMNTVGGTGLWDENSGFYYDQLKLPNESSIPLRIRSLVGIVPFFAIGNIPSYILNPLKDFTKRQKWFLKKRKDLAKQVNFLELQCPKHGNHVELFGISIPSKSQIEKVVKYLFDEKEFLSPYGIRSLSRYHEDHPYIFQCGKEEYKVEYVPGESNSSLFGGNSNWRGPIWFPMNFLLIESLERIHSLYGDKLQVEFPTGSGNKMNLSEAADQIMGRLVKLFLPDEDGKRPCHGDDKLFANDPYWKDLILFYEYFHGDSGKGLGASHQTGWTSLVVVCLDELGKNREKKSKKSSKYKHKGFQKELCQSYLEVNVTGNQKNW